MGCKCSKEDEIGDFEIDDYDYPDNDGEYNEHQEMSIDNIKSHAMNRSVQGSAFNNLGGMTDTNENMDSYHYENKNLSSSMYQYNRSALKQFSGSQKFDDDQEKTKNEKEYMFSQTQQSRLFKKNMEKKNEDLNQSGHVPSMMSYEQSFAKKKKKSGTNHKYNTSIMKLFNLARNKPLSFCKHIDYCVGLITTNAEGQLVLGTDKTNKIGLKDGISKFNESKRFLLHIDSCEELSYDMNLEIEISENPDLWLNNEYIKNKIMDKQSELLNISNLNSTSDTKKSDYTIFGFHFDFGMSDPTISSVLQIVDDNNCENRRRYNILNSEYKAVGITNRASGNKFVSYFFFAG